MHSVHHRNSSPPTRSSPAATCRKSAYVHHIVSSSALPLVLSVVAEGELSQSLFLIISHKNPLHQRLSPPPTSILSRRKTPSTENTLTELVVAPPDMVDAGLPPGFCAPFHAVSFSTLPDVPLQQRAAVASFEMPYVMLIQFLLI